MSANLKLLTSNVIFFGSVAVVARALNVVGLPILAWLIDDTGTLGRFDLLISLGALGAAIANFGINEAAQKLYFEDSGVETRRSVLSHMVTVGLVATAAVLLLLLLAYFVFRDYLLTFRVDAAFAAMILLFILFFRLRFLYEVPLVVENRRRVIGGVALFEILLFLLAAIFLLRVINEKFVALCAARLLALSISIILLYRRGLGEWFRLSLNGSTTRRLLRIGFPLTFSSVFYWGLSLADRVVIATFLGSGALGAYSVCAKFAAVSELIRSGVSQGMSYFFYSTSSEGGHGRRMYLVVSFILVASTVIFAIGQLVAAPLVGVLLPGDYAGAAIIIPYLLLGPLLLTAFQIVASELVLIERTALITKAQLVGVVVTLGSAIPLVKLLGLIGPAIAAVFGYLTMFFVGVYFVSACGRQSRARELALWAAQLGGLSVASSLGGPSESFLVVWVAVTMMAIWCYVNREFCSSAYRLVLRGVR